LPETHAILLKIRAELDAYRADKLLLAEANQWPEDVSAYFGTGDECHMAYHFPLMPRIYMAIAQEDRFPISDILRQTPDIPANCQWALFLRNHDELTLEMVTDVERDYLWSTYATDPRARINLGIRRRLAPLMDNDRRKIELMNSLLMSLPGTPIIYYGDEIGMGDNIYLGDRNGVRTPMQWTPDQNGGFSRCDPARLYLPMIMDPVYGYESVNVEAQSRSLASLLSWTKRLISVRKSSCVFGRGSLTILRPANRAVFAYVRQYQDEVLLCVANLARSAQAVEIDLSRWQGRVPRELLGRTDFPPIGGHPYIVTLAPYGFFWFQLVEREGTEDQERRITPEFVTLVVTAEWESTIRGRSGHTLESEVLPSYLAGRRWFPERDPSAISARIRSAIPMLLGDPGIALVLVDTEVRGAKAQYTLPLSITWTRLDHATSHPSALAAARRGPREGMLCDVSTEISFIKTILDNLRTAHTTEAHGNCRIEFRPSSKLTGDHVVTIDNVRGMDTEQSNTSVLVGTNYVVKLFRRREVGVNPEIEVGQFLTEHASFANTPPLLGTVELIEGDTRSAVAVVHRFVENQGDAWTVTSAYLDRFVDDQRLLTADADHESDESVAYQQRMREVGHRVAEMQLALASRDDISDFEPEPIVPEDVDLWAGELLQRADQIFDELTRLRHNLSDADRILVDNLLSRRALLSHYTSNLLSRDIKAEKIRHHGDLHLGQMLIVKDDVFIIDFEGEPRRTLKERRRKAPAARDVAGLIRSIDYSVTAALERGVQTAPDDHGRLARALNDWRRRATASVLASYRENMIDPRLWPEDPQQAARMLDFFLLEKAFYEIGYELAHRPNWLRVPLAGMWRILRPNEGLQE
jgi:maltose alpha-D-glucosyltransferase/alpha-amylase